MSYTNDHDLWYESIRMPKGKSSCKISEALDQGEPIICIFIDFSKAFDTVDLLSSKLELHGVRDIALEWFKTNLVTCDT